MVNILGKEFGSLSTRTKYQIGTDNTNIALLAGGTDKLPTSYPYIVALGADEGHEPPALRHVHGHQTLRRPHPVVLPDPSAPGDRGLHVAAVLDAVLPLHAREVQAPGVAGFGRARAVAGRGWPTVRSRSTTPRRSP